MNNVPIRTVNPFEYPQHIVWILLCWIGINGCMATQPFPMAARAGDTITLAVGTPDAMTRGNTSVVFIPDSDPGNPVTLHDTAGGVTTNLVSIFKLYPDKASQVWLSSQDVLDLTSSARHAPWLTVIALNLPATMPVGTGVIRVTTSAAYPDRLGQLAHVNDVPIAFEVLDSGSSTPAPNPFSYSYAAGTTTPGDLSVLQPVQTLVVAPPKLSSGSNAFAAAEIKLRIPSLLTLPGVDLKYNFRVITDDMPQNLASQLQTIWTRSGDILTVTFISPGSTFLYFETTFSIVGLFGDTAGAQVISARYYDQNGNEVPAPVPLNDLTQWKIAPYDVLL